MRRLPLAPAALAVCLAAPLAVPVARAQTTPRPARTTRSDAADSLRTYEAAPVVVTATRRATRLSDAPVPVSVVGRAEIAAQQPLRLADLLADQPGLTVVSGLGGAGVQMQGLDPAYTLILVDGEPVVGRTAGVLDLERLTVAGVERVEIVRGPTSSRYGSDALAGVVNLITRVPGRGLRGEASVRAETNATSDLTLQGEGGTDRLGLRLLVNRYGSGGFDLDPDAAGQNGPRVDDVSGEARLSASPSDALTLDVTARAATQRQDNEIALTGGLFDDTGSRRELSLAPRARLRLRPSLLLDASASAAAFATTTRLVSTETGAVTDDTDLSQTYGKAEATLTYVPSARTALYAGGGAIREGIGGDRYASARHAWQGFGFAEATLRTSRRVDVNASARYDRHSDYAPSLTPKLAVLVRPSASTRLRASVGSGFKAPAFRQLYLDFTNTGAGGYSVYGASDVARQIAALQAQGGISEILVDPATLGGIAAERSVAVSAGGEATRGRLSARVNLFRNDIRDLIETQQVAVKTNGQAVFSYANLARVTTQGIEAEAAWTARIGASGAESGAPAARRAASLRLSASYQYLDTADRGVLAEIDAGTLYRITASGAERRVTRGDYGGLLGRSRHSGTVRADLRGARGETASLRVVWRGRFGDRAGLNGNLVLDDPREYVGGYGLVGVTLAHPLGALLRRGGMAGAGVGLDRATLSLGARNLLDHTDSDRLPTLAGRAVFGGLAVRF